MIIVRIVVIVGIVALSLLRPTLYPLPPEPDLEEVSDLATRGRPPLTPMTY